MHRLTELYRRLLKNESLTLWLVTLLVLISRLPFLWNGYGTEEDSWGLVINAWDIRETGHYVFSRLPGHPVQEFLLALFPYAGCFVFNLFSALFSALAVHFFMRIVRFYGFRYWPAAGLALAFIPVFYISSTYTIDYSYALAFIMIAWYAMLRRQLGLAGLMIGLAVGCRLSSALMVLPLAIALWGHYPSGKFRALLLFGIFALAASLLVYAIPLYTYGPGLISTYNLPYPPIPKALYKGSIGVWGIPGCLALILAVIAVYRNRKKVHENLDGSLKSYWQPVAWGIAILLNLAIFIRLPEKSAFMIPALPFLLLLLAYFMKTRKSFLRFCALTIISPFILSINLADNNRGADYSKTSLLFKMSGQVVFFDALNGPIFSDYSKRQNKKVYTEAVILKMDTLSKPTVIIAGWWYNELVVRLHEGGKSPRAALTAHADESTLRRDTQQGIALFYLEEIDRINDRRYGSEFTGKYARLF